MLSLFEDGNISKDKKIDVRSKKSEQLLAVYYLKYHLGDKFDFIKNDLRYYLFDMEHAEKLNPLDIWPLYWTAYFKTDKAIVSDKKSDYKSALNAWEKLFENDLFYASPVIKLTYEKASLCEEKTAESDFYKNKAESVNPLLDIDFEWYGYFGF